MPSELPENDFNLLWKLSSAYHAVASSACDPVVVSGMFYDCTDDEEEGIRIMRKRLEVAPADIRTHLQIHDDLRDCFYSIEESLNGNNRSAMAQYSSTLYDHLKRYGALVKEHMARVGETAFLHYPSCVGGHYFFVPRSRVIPANEFNPKGKRRDFANEIEIGRFLVREFSYGSAPLRGIKLTDLQDEGEGISDCSIRGRLELTQELLKRAGFER